MNTKVKAETETETETVAEACERRRNCRAGLSGLRMKHLASGREFRCDGSMWEKDQALILFRRTAPRLSAEEQRARAVAYIHERHGEGSYKARKQIQLYDLGVMDLGVCGAISGPPPEPIPASECVLLERWPVVCCRPRRRKAKARKDP
jgi:hypothetical protein